MMADVSGAREDNAFRLMPTRVGVPRKIADLRPTPTVEAASSSELLGAAALTALGVPGAALGRSLGRA